MEGGRRQWLKVIKVSTFNAVYDETLILNQLEPPTFDSGSPLFNDAPPQSNGSRRQSKKVTLASLQWWP